MKFLQKTVQNNVEIKYEGCITIMENLHLTYFLDSAIIKNAKEMILKYKACFVRRKMLFQKENIRIIAGNIAFFEFTCSLLFREKLVFKSQVFETTYKHTNLKTLKLYMYKMDNFVNRFTCCSFD